MYSRLQLLNYVLSLMNLYLFGNVEFLLGLEKKTKQNKNTLSLFSYTNLFLNLYAYTKFRFPYIIMQTENDTVYLK